MSTFEVTMATPFGPSVAHSTRDRDEAYRLLDEEKARSKKPLAWFVREVRFS